MCLEKNVRQNTCVQFGACRTNAVCSVNSMQLHPVHSFSWDRSTVQTQAFRAIKILIYGGNSTFDRVSSLKVHKSYMYYIDRK